MLFRSGPPLGHRRPVQSGDFPPWIAHTKELCDAEIEEANLTLGGDEDVGRFEVSVDDEVGVRVLHHAAEIGEEPQPVGPGHLRSLTVFRNGKTLDILKHQVWLSIRGDTAIQQRHDRRMGEPRQDITLQPKTLEHLR